MWLGAGSQLLQAGADYDMMTNSGERVLTPHREDSEIFQTIQTWMTGTFPITLYWA